MKRSAFCKLVAFVFQYHCISINLMMFYVVLSDAAVITLSVIAHEASLFARFQFNKICLCKSCNIFLSSPLMDLTEILHVVQYIKQRGTLLAIESLRKVCLQFFPCISILHCGIEGELTVGLIMNSAIQIFSTTGILCITFEDKCHL